MSIYRDIFKWADKKGDTDNPIEPEESPEEMAHPLDPEIPRLLANDLQVLQENIETIRREEPFSSVLITSSIRREGCSVLSANWGKLLARERLITSVLTSEKSENGGFLLIDANLRKPAIHSLFNLDRKRGLTELLNSELDLDQVLKSTSRKNLWAITAGKPAANPADLLGSDVMKGVLDKCKKKFQFIILDSPPATLYAETLALAKQVEAIVLVVKSGVTRWEVALSCRKQLQKVNPRLLGVVLNQRKYYIPEWIYQRI